MKSALRVRKRAKLEPGDEEFSMENLHGDILIRVFHATDVFTRSRMQRVCKKWNDLLSNTASLKGHLKIEWKHVERLKAMEEYERLFTEDDDEYDRDRPDDETGERIYNADGKAAEVLHFLVTRFSGPQLRVLHLSGPPESSYSLSDPWQKCLRLSDLCRILGEVSQPSTFACCQILIEKAYINLRWWSRYPLPERVSRLVISNCKVYEFRYRDFIPNDEEGPADRGLLERIKRELFISTCGEWTVTLAQVDLALDEVDRGFSPSFWEKWWAAWKVSCCGSINRNRARRHWQRLCQMLARADNQELCTRFNERRHVVDADVDWSDPDSAATIDDLVKFTLVRGLAGEDRHREWKWNDREFEYEPGLWDSDREVFSGESDSERSRYDDDSDEYRGSDDSRGGDDDW